MPSYFRALYHSHVRWPFFPIVLWCLSFNSFTFYLFTYIFDICWTQELIFLWFIDFLHQRPKASEKAKLLNRRSQIRNKSTLMPWFTIFRLFIGTVIWHGNRKRWQECTVERETITRWCKAIVRSDDIVSSFYRFSPFSTPLLCTSHRPVVLYDPPFVSYHWPPALNHLSGSTVKIVICDLVEQNYDIKDSAVEVLTGSHGECNFQIPGIYTHWKSILMLCRNRAGTVMSD